MKRILIPLLFLLLPLAVCGQQTVNAELLGAVNRYLSTYRSPENYVPKDAMKADSVRVDEAQRRVRIYPGEVFCSQPLTPAIVANIYRELPARLPQPYNAYRVVILGKADRELSDYVPNYLREDGRDASRMWGSVGHRGNPWVIRLTRPYRVDHGLEGRHLAVTASHGRYFGNGAWRWQRPYLFTTNEDLLTQSFVHPYLIPMLERAGAVVYSARERDPQTHSVVVDNDTPADTAAHYYREASSEQEQWTSMGDVGFGMPGLPLQDGVNPFRQGTARRISATTRRSRLSSVTWMPRLPKAGRYAVYVSYATVAGSVSDARYTVYHKGGQTQFRVNQQMGGGTWVYLGTFDFDAGANRTGRVVLQNRSDYHGGVVTADAVRFGGGMGQTARGRVGTSRMPQFLEGSRYYAQWCGLDASYYNQTDGTNDYKDEIRTRAYLTNYVGGGSAYQPGQSGLRVPLEMYLAVHSDAGIRTDQSIYGSLGICTTVKEDSTTRYPAGISRKASLDLAGLVLGGVTSDLTRQWGITWSRRELYDRNYAETRMPDIPSTILEMFSHQNYRDLLYAHDPLFKQSMARAIYKSVLRFVNQQHGRRDFVVQPLPVRRFAARLDEAASQVHLSWSPMPDTLEQTARPTAYVVYTRLAGEGFDEGQLVSDATELTLKIRPGLRYDFRVSAVNAGGESAPSEVLSVYQAPQSKGHVLLVDGFQRLSGPARVENADSIGFLLERDLGVPDEYTASFTGHQIDFSPSAAGREGPGALGYSDKELEGRIIGGNTHDYAARHGAALAASGLYSFSSATREAWLQGAVRSQDYAAIDLILGAQCDAPHNLRPFKTFDLATRRLLTDYLQHGGGLLVSGQYVGSDMQSQSERAFLRDVLKVRLSGTQRQAIRGEAATSSRLTDGLTSLTITGLDMAIPMHCGLNASCYPIQSCDVLSPTSPEAFTAFIYPDGTSAGVAYPGSTYRVLTTGFPLEAISNTQQLEETLVALIAFLVQ